MFKGKSAYYELLSAAAPSSSTYTMKDFNNLKANQRETSVTMYNHNKKGVRAETIKKEQQPSA